MFSCRKFCVHLQCYLRKFRSVCLDHTITCSLRQTVEQALQHLETHLKLYATKCLKPVFSSGLEDRDGSVCTDHVGWDGG